MSKTKAVIFEVSKVQYGINIKDAYKIIRPQATTPIVGSSSVIEGVISLRDKVIPVIKLSQYLGLPASDDSEETRIIITEINNKQCGLIVDYVSEVEEFDDEEIQDIDLGGGNNQYIKGIVKKGDQLWLILNLSKFNF